MGFSPNLHNVEYDGAKITESSLQRKDGAQRATLGDILVLGRLYRRERVVLVETVRGSATRNNDTKKDTTRTACAG